MTLLVINLFMLLVLFIFDTSYILSFEVSFICSYIIVYTSLRSIHAKVSLLSTVPSNCDSNDEKLRKMSMKSKIFLGARISLGLYRLLSYLLLTIGIIALINNNLFFIVPFFLGTITCVVGMCIGWYKKI